MIYTGHKGPVYCGAFEGTGTYLLTGGHDKKINLYNVNSSKPVATYTGHSWEVHDVSIASDGRTFLSGGVDKTLLLWDVTAKRVIRRFTGHQHLINAVFLELRPLQPQRHMTEPSGSGTFDRLLAFH